MIIHKLLAKPISYAKEKRNRKNIKYIVIHNTGNKGDTAKNNANYFAKSNTRQAGAHFFVDQNGIVYKSVSMDRTAWSVGGAKYSGTEGGKYYNKCTNYNSVSIELCDIYDKEPSAKMIKSTKKLIKHIRRWCPNAKTIIRHWDVNGKECPYIMSSKNNAAWNKFKDKIV